MIEIRREGYEVPTYEDGTLKEDWVALESLLPKLIEADNKLTPIQTKVALKRIIKELETKE
jgi:hypothetical protein